MKQEMWVEYTCKAGAGKGAVLSRIVRKIIIEKCHFNITQNERMSSD